MTLAFRIVTIANFDKLASADDYMGIGLGWAIALQKRGFSLAGINSTGEGIETAYEFSMKSDFKKTDISDLLKMTGQSLQDNRNEALNAQRDAAFQGLSVRLEFHTVGHNVIEALLLKSGHMELLNILRANGFVATSAAGTDKDKIVMTLRLSIENPIEFTTEMFNEMSAALQNGAEPDDVAKMRATTYREQGKYPQLIFQNAKIGYVLGSNTFRLGDKWFNKLNVGDIVEAVDGGGNRLGWLKVKTLAKDTLAAALKRDALQNHGVKEMEIESGEEAHEYLTHVLGQVYPNDVLSIDTIVTVIGFEAQFVTVEPKAFA